MIGPDIVKDIEAKVQVIRQRLKAASDRQKSYVDLKMKDVEYEVGDKVFLKVSPWRKVLRFGNKGKLSPRFIGSYEVLERIVPVAYRLALPQEFSKLHDVFHVSMLRKYRSDESHILPVQEIQVQEDFSYNEEPKASSRGETVAEQTSTVSGNALATPWQRRSYLGSRSNYDSTVFATLRIRYEFR